MKEKIDQKIKDGKIRFVGTKLPEDWYQGFLEWKSDWENNQSVDALYNMAYCYGNGEGTKMDKEKAIELYEKTYSLGIKESLSMIHANMLSSYSYEDKSEEEALALDNKFRCFYERVRDAGYGNTDLFFDLLDRAPLVRKYSSLAKSRKWDEFDRALATETNPRHPIVVDLITTRELEVNFKQKYKMSSATESTGSVTNGSTNFIRVSYPQRKSNITIKNNSRTEVSGRIRYPDGSYSQHPILGLKPSHVFKESQSYTGGHEMQAGRTAYVTVLSYDPQSKHYTGTFGQFINLLALPEVINVELKNVNLDIQAPPSDKDLSKKRNRTLFIALSLLIFYIIMQHS
ncbi:hypothetical protein [Rosenbergiella australiborealis]|uniref:SEL1-like repeat protein n=1 Tax=Rosenbergiella australiborealis TaxID=1544696 RepID=UPI001F4D6019|nr:hypothetical protein [Rosenbergiella australiborealis]